MANHDDPVEKRFQEIEANADSPVEQTNEEPKKDMATKLVEAILATGIVLFYDQNNDPYVAADGNGSNVIKIHSPDSKIWLTGYIYTQHKKVVNAEITNRILQALAARALYDGEQYSLEVRSVRDTDGLWYDLGQDAVRVTKKGWSVTPQPPIVFKRFRHQKPQVVPQRGGDLRQLLKYINLPDEQEQLLFLVNVVAAFIPGFPHPLLILHGPQGAGKTTPMTIMKELIDPSALKEGFALHRDIFEFAQVANQNWFLFYDNLSNMPEWFSDALSRASTGSGFSKRQLYTDDDSIIYSFQRTIALNGINQVVYKSDLLDRSILIHLERISDKERKEYEVFWNEFRADQPKILGAIFDVLVTTLVLHPTVNLSRKPRMADFTRWGYAIAEAAGFSGKSFIQAYRSNIAIQHDEAVEANPVAKLIVEFMKDREEWTAGTPTDLYGALEVLAFQLKLSQSKGWPKDVSRFGRSLTIITPNLYAKGIDIERSKGKDRLITIRKFTVDADAADVTPSENHPDDDTTTATTVQEPLL
jgi:hypothetical protein